MYTPPKFNITDNKEIKKIIAENAFATVISFTPENDIFINHLPLIFEGDSDVILIGHMAKKNPQWEHFRENSKATVIIQGPHAYISPSWYVSGRDVPTWNYAVAHLHGRVELIKDFREQVKVLSEMSKVFDSGWKFSLPDDLKTEADLNNAIISFRFHIEKIEAKFKLSQNRGEDDREGVRAGLLSRGDEMSLAIKKLMDEN